MQSRKLSGEENNWTKIGPEIYNDAIFNNPIISQVTNRQIQEIQELATSSSSLVEVGCGTCKFILSFKDQVKYIVGVDISDVSLNYVRETNKQLQNLALIKGDAMGLTSLLRSEFFIKTEFWIRPRIIACVTNTLGIMPASIRQSVVDEMVKAMGVNGKLFLSVFNAEFFDQGVRDFYKKVPSLCGDIQDSDVNYSTHELRVASTGYYTHWFTEAELVSLLQKAGLSEYSIKRHGVALMVTGSN